MLLRRVVSTSHLNLLTWARKDYSNVRFGWLPIHRAFYSNSAPNKAESSAVPQHNRTETTRIPLAAGTIGVAGLIPFVGSALGIIYYPSATTDLLHLQSAYGATILSFMGAVHWVFLLIHSLQTILFSRLF